MHVVKYLLENRVRIIEDVSVMGYDNILFSNFTVPKLSVIDHKIFELGSTVSDNLINKVGKNRFKERRIVVDPKLVIRDSVRKIYLRYHSHTGFFKKILLVLRYRREV